MLITTSISSFCYRIPLTVPSTCSKSRPSKTHSSEKTLTTTNNSYMDNTVKTWLYDILTAIEEIESFFQDSPKRYDDYCRDVRTKRAVERNIGIIGEAMHRILKHDCTIEVSNARKIVDVRNRVVHGYDSVSDETIWGIVIKHIPVLKAEIENLLGEWPI